MKHLDLKKFRKEKNLTQHQFADIVGALQSFVSQAENGHDNIPDTWIERLEAHYGPIDWSQYAAPEKPAADGKSDTTPELVEVLRQELAAKNALIDKLTDLLAKKIGE